MGFGDAPDQRHPQAQTSPIAGTSAKRFKGPALFAFGKTCAMIFDGKTHGFGHTLDPQHDRWGSVLFGIVEQRRQRPR